MRWLWYCLLTALLPLQSAVATADAGEWRIEGPHSAAHFAVKHLLVATVRGSFSHVEGRAFIDDQDVSRSWVTAEIHTSSLYSGSWARDQLLMGEHFLAVQSFPRIVFRSTKVARAPQGHLLVTGVLTIRDRSREVTFEVEGPTRAVRDREGRQVRAVVARARFDRKAFGMTWQTRLEDGGLELGDEVEVELDAELVSAESAGAVTGSATPVTEPSAASAVRTNRPTATQPTVHGAER